MYSDPPEYCGRKYAEGKLDIAVVLRIVMS